MKLCAVALLCLALQACASVRVLPVCPEISVAEYTTPRGKFYVMTAADIAAFAQIVEDKTAGRCRLAGEESAA